MENLLKKVFLVVMMLTAMEAHSFLNKHQPTLAKVEIKNPGIYCDGGGNWYSGSTCLWQWYKELPTVHTVLQVEINQEECLADIKTGNHNYVAMNAAGTSCFGLPDTLPESSTPCSSSTKDGYCFCGVRQSAWPWVYTGSECTTWYRSDIDVDSVQNAYAFAYGWQYSTSTTDSDTAAKVQEVKNREGMNLQAIVQKAADNTKSGGVNNIMYTLFDTRSFRLASMSEDDLCESGVTNKGNCWCFVNEDLPFVDSGPACKRWYHSDTELINQDSTTSKVELFQAPQTWTKHLEFSFNVQGDAAYMQQQAGTDNMIIGTKALRRWDHRTANRQIFYSVLDTPAFIEQNNLKEDNLCVSGATYEGYCYCALNEPVFWEYTGTECQRWYHFDKEPTKEFFSQQTTTTFTSFHTIKDVSPTDAVKMIAADNLIAVSLANLMEDIQTYTVLFTDTAAFRQENRFYTRSEGLHSLCESGVTNVKAGGYCYCFLDDDQYQAWTYSSKCQWMGMRLPPTDDMTWIDTWQAIGGDRYENDQDKIIDSIITEEKLVMLRQGKEEKDYNKQIVIATKAERQATSGGNNNFQYSVMEKPGNYFYGSNSDDWYGDCLYNKTREGWCYCLLDKNDW